MATRLANAVVVAMVSAAAGAGAQPRSGHDVSVVRPGMLVPPPVAAPCRPGACPFAGQRVTLLVFQGEPIAGAVRELRPEFEAATGATLDIAEVPFNEHFDRFISDVTNRAGRYDATIAGAYWLGELVAGDFILPYGRWLGDARFPRWQPDDVLPGPRDLLSYAGRPYMVANDHDGQVMYFRRDLLADPQHRHAFAQQYGYPLGVPATWAQFRDVAAYFNGKDLNGDGVPDHGVVLPLKAGVQGMFHFMSLSAPFVIGPANPRLYWFDPQTMKPLIDSPGHVRALATLVGLVPFGPKEMLSWELGKGWDHFLAGRAALTLTWGDLGALAQQQGSRIKGRIGTAALPGTSAYYDLQRRTWVETAAPNRVGNTTGGSWAGVIARHAKAPAAAYYLLALMASPQKSQVYAARGWDGIDPGRRSHFLPPHGSATLDTYLRAGWDEADVRDYLGAYHDNFSNRLQFPYLRIPGTYGYWQALDRHLAAAAAGQLDAQAAMKAAAIDFEEITIRLGREAQRRAYRASLGL